MAKKETNNDGINQNILNLITPSGLEFKKASLLIGENYAKCITISNYPTNPNYGWLGQFTAIEGTTASIEFEPTDSGALVSRCNEQIRDLRADLTTVKDESVRQNKERAIEDIKNMIDRINREGETVGYVNTILLIQASTEEKLEEQVKKVNSIIAANLGSTRNLTFLQREAFRCLSPYGIPNALVSDVGTRNMPMSTFIGGFANASSGLNDGTGYMIGKTDNGKPIIIDTWRRGGDRTNGNWIITGLPGVGKSATVKSIIIREYGLGAKVIFLDPESEYVELVQNLGGKVINCGGGRGGRINPLQVRSAPIEEEERKGISDLALHFQTMRTFFRLYKKGITELELSKLEQILEKTYERFGIVWDTDIKILKNTEFPIFSDLYEDIQKELEQHPEEVTLKNIDAYIRSAAQGADAQVFNGYTDVEIDTSIIDLDVSNLLEGDESILEAQFHNINSFVWNIVSRDRTEQWDYVIEEGHLIVDPDNPQPLIFVKNFSKRCRKYEANLFFITHSVVDILDPAVKRYGQAIIDNACYKFIMGTDGKNLEETVNLFKLTEAEEALLLSKQRGRGLLYAGSGRYSARIEIPEKFLQIMGKSGGR